MPDKTLGNEHPINVRAVADVKEHIRNTRSGRLFKRGQHAPNTVHLLFHTFLFRPYRLSCGIILWFCWDLLGRVARLTKSDVPEFVNHVAFRMPVLILAVAKNLNKLLEDCSLAAIAPLCVLRRVVVVAVHISFVLLVAVLGSKDGWAKGTCKMVDVVLPV